MTGPIPEAILFDCDGVLVDSEVLAMEVEIALLAEAGLAYEPADYRRRFLGLADAAFMAALDADRRARLGEGLSPGFAAALHERRHAEVHARLTEVRGAGRAIGALGLAKAVASSSGVIFLERKMRRTGLWDLFAPHVYSADLVARAKPAPDVFLHAAAAIDIAPKGCLVLEDSVNGVRAGLAAGMRVWGFIGGGHCDAAWGDMLLAAGAERVLGDWAAAEALFTEWSR